jgi:hypothetical protein
MNRADHPPKQKHSVRHFGDDVQQDDTNPASGLYKSFMRVVFQPCHPSEIQFQCVLIPINTNNNKR